MPTWRILEPLVSVDRGVKVPFRCTCGVEATMTVIGHPLAQVGSGIVFDTGNHEIPAKIQCRKCGRVFAREVDDVR